MYLQMFTVYDKKAAAYLQPFFMRSEAEAVRAMMQTANNSDTQFAKTPEDFQLVHVGEFDDLTGCVVSRPHRIICEVNSLKMSPKELFEQEAG